MSKAWPCCGCSPLLRTLRTNSKSFLLFPPSFFSRFYNKNQGNRRPNSTSRNVVKFHVFPIDDKCERCQSRCTRVRNSWNHRMDGVGRNLKDPLVQPPFVDTASFHYTRLLKSHPAWPRTLPDYRTDTALPQWQKLCFL